LRTGPRRCGFGRSCTAPSKRWWTRGMPGMRRVFSKISGALAGARDEASQDVQEDRAVTVPTAPPAQPEVTDGDPACVAAVDVARAAAVEVAGPAVGVHLGVEVDDAHVVTHSFATTEKAYTGWRWAVTVA